MTGGVTGMTPAPRGLLPRPRRPRQRRRRRRRRSRRRRKSSVVTAEDVREAAAGLAGVAVRTPLRFVEPLNAYVKLESLQPTAAFKLRGAYTAIRRMSYDARRGGVITYSSGNHGQAVAYAAQLVGVRAVVVMPETAPAVKVTGVKRWGGEVVLAGRTSEDRQRAAEQIAARERLAVVPPFDHLDIVAGAGSGRRGSGGGRAPAPPPRAPAGRAGPPPAGPGVPAARPAAGGAGRRAPPGGPGGGGGRAARPPRGGGGGGGAPAPPPGGGLERRWADGRGGGGGGGGGAGRAGE